jgi:hypothetical protein
MIDKIEIARRQLGTALALFLQNLDPVSVHVLACGGGEVAQHLTMKSGSQPFQAFLDVDIRSYKKLWNKYWNAFKHATTREGLDRKDEDEVREFSDEANDHVLLIAWTDYHKAERRLPIEAQGFLAWYYARYPEKVVPHTPPEWSLKFFGEDIVSVSRAEAKARLNRAIEFARSRDEVMLDSRTDPRPLLVVCDASDRL